MGSCVMSKLEYTLFLLIVAWTILQVVMCLFPHAPKSAMGGGGGWEMNAYYLEMKQRKV